MLHLCPGIMFIADYGNHLIRQWNASSGLLSTIAGRFATPGWSPDGPASQSLAFYPKGMVVGPPSGALAYDVFWSDSGSGVIRRYNGATVATVAGTPRGYGYFNGPPLTSKFGSGGPAGLAFFGNDLFIADSGENMYTRGTITSKTTRF